MMSEQSMERLHRTFKRYARLYATMGDTAKRLTTTMKRAYLAIHPSIPALHHLSANSKDRARQCRRRSRRGQAGSPILISSNSTS
jgi:hypothetical protein